MASGCSPTLYTASGVTHYRAGALCSQGPLEVSLEAYGDKWGESILLEAHSPRDIAGFYEVLVDGKLHARGGWGKTKEVLLRQVASAQVGGGASNGRGSANPSGSQGASQPKDRFVLSSLGEQQVSGPDNHRCFSGAGGVATGPARAGAVGGVKAPQTPGKGDRPPPVGKGAGQGGGADTVPAEAGAGGALAPAHGLEKASWEAQLEKWPERIFRFQVMRAGGSRPERSSCFSEHLGARNVFPRGAKIIVRLWSSQPNDLEDVLFSVKHERKIASSAWEKRQKKRFQACLRKHPDQKRRWEAIEREKRRRDELAAKRGKEPLTTYCIKHLPEPIKDPMGRPYMVGVIRPCSCLQAPKDETCWGEGGLEGLQRRLAQAPPRDGSCYAEREISRYSFTKRLRFQRPCDCFQKLDDVSCWGAGGNSAYEKDLLDKAFDSPCARSLWVDTRAPLPGAGAASGRSRGGSRARPATRRPGPTFNPLMPERYYHSFERPCPCYGKLEDQKCWGKGGYQGFLEGLRLSFPTEGRCKVHHHTPHPTRRHATWLLPVEKPCGCFHRASDEACWGKGGKDVFLKALVARFTRALSAERTSGQSGAGATGSGAVSSSELAKRQLEADRRTLQLQRQQEAAERRLKELRARETANAPKRQDQPAGVGLELPPKPPPPRVETPPDRPSQNAVWIPGYWHRGGSSWHWFGGWWRVPQTDVTAGLTVRAAKAPPPPKAQGPRPVSPAADAVWLPGYWHWHGGRFLWIEGRWLLPPQRGRQWRPPSWRAIKGGAVFVPGAWVLPLR